MNRLRWLLLLCVSFCLGCDTAPPDPSVAVKGKILLNGQPLVVKDLGPSTCWSEVKFYLLDSTGIIGDTTQFYQASLGADGSFNVLGTTNKGLVPGKYRVVVRQWEPYPELDKLGDKFSESNSKITWNISGPTEIQLDLASPPTTEMGM